MASASAPGTARRPTVEAPFEVRRFKAALPEAGRMADSPPGEHVFLVSCDPEDFERTVATPVVVEDHPDPPEALEGEGSVRLWGAPEGTRTVEAFERMEPGDLLLFYADGTYVGVGRVGRTFADDDAWASESLWSAVESTNLFTVTDFTPVSVGLAAVNAIFGYSGSYVPQGLMRVAPDRVTARPAAIELAVRRYDEAAA